MQAPWRRAVIVGSLGTGLWTILVLSWLDASFVKSLVLACASSAATGCFGIYITRLQIRAQERLHERLDRVESHQADVAIVLGVNRRPGDPGYEQPPQPQQPLSGAPDPETPGGRADSPRRPSP